MPLRIGVLAILLVFNLIISAQNIVLTQPTHHPVGSADSVQMSIDFLKKHIQSQTEWTFASEEMRKVLIGLIHFSEDVPIDTVLQKIQQFQQSNGRYISGYSHEKADTLHLAGYNSYPVILEKLKLLDRELRSTIVMEEIPLPDYLKPGADGLIPPIPPGAEQLVFELTGLVLPDSLENIHLIADSLVQTKKELERKKRLTKLRNDVIENERIKYNNQLKNIDPETNSKVYRQYALNLFSEIQQNKLRDSLKLMNERVLVQYNDSMLTLINDSITKHINVLKRKAIDQPESIWIQSLSGQPKRVYLHGNSQLNTRLYIKNEQNDSLGIMLRGLDRQHLQIMIDDHLSFNRITGTKQREVTFEEFVPEKKLVKINRSFNLISPWSYGGYGNIGFTQTYLNNWKAGGESAFAVLAVLKGFANYKDDKMSWENFMELRNGWIKQGGDYPKPQKNDDKIEIISRIGVKAFKSWYYSGEIDFITQFFNGYKYPDKNTVISGFMSPAKTMMKFGLDYKPNKNFSLFLSPFTSKNVFVKDTARIDQTKYGVAENKQSYWENGLNADLRYKVELSPQITYETKYKMFLNYRQPFQKFDINWENTVIAQLTTRINLTFNLFLLYDDNVTFATGDFDVDGKEIYRAKWQVKELMTVGFNYKINQKTYKRKYL